jgi:hypothetical protein
MIPLHTLSVSQELYPRPDVLLKMTGENPSESVWGHIKNPHQLYFFTTGDKTPVESWQAYPGVDFPIQEVTDLEVVPDLTPGQSKAQTAPPLRTGLANFTFDIDLQNAKINLLRGRAENAVEAAIENVTLSRIDQAQKPMNVPVDHALFVSVQDQLSDFSSSISKSAQNLRDSLNLQSADDYINHIAGIPQEFEGKIKNLSQQLSAAVNGSIKNTEQLLVKKQEALESAWEKANKTYLEPLINELKDTWASKENRAHKLELLSAQLLNRCVLNAPSSASNVVKSIRTLIE